MSIGLLSKATLEAIYFKDKNNAKKTLYVWAISAVSLILSFGLTLFLNNMV